MIAPSVRGYGDWCVAYAVIMWRLRSVWGICSDQVSMAIGVWHMQEAEEGVKAGYHRAVEAGRVGPAFTVSFAITLEQSKGVSALYPSR